MNKTLFSQLRLLEREDNVTVAKAISQVSQHYLLYYSHAS